MKGYILLIVLCVSIFHIQQSKLLEYIPPSRSIDVIEGDEYTFGLKETEGEPNITRCHYSSNSGINGGFDIIRPEQSETRSKYDFKQFNTKVVYNEIDNYGKIGLCEMIVRYVDDKGPSSWILQPSTTDGQLPGVTFGVNFFYKVPLIIDQVIIRESSSFFQYLSTTRTFVRCSVKFNNVEMELSLDSFGTNFNTPLTSTADETISKKVKSLGRSLCGFQFQNAALTDSLQWTLTGTDVQGQRHRAIFKSTIFSKTDDSELHTKEETGLGEFKILQCGSMFDQSYCLFYNPQNKLVQSDKTCSISITSIGMSDIGKWKCSTGINELMESKEYSVELLHRGYDRIEKWVNETENFLKIGCRLENYRYASILYCRMRSPNNATYNLIPGAATERYVSIGTDFDNKICAMEIEKPIQEYENGIWRCEIGTSSGVTGALIQIGETIVPDYPRYIKVTAQLNKPAKIQCEVPYSSTYCHIRAPNGTTYSSHNDFQTTLGVCSMQIEAVTHTDNGTWFCSFAREMGISDEQIVVEVTIAEVLSYYRNIEADVGDTVNLLCSSGGLPLNYCRFISPNGLYYYIYNHQNSNYISYYGKGLEYGDCGITINEVKVSDQGPWTCVTRIGTRFQQPEISAQINLDITPNLLDDPNIATAIGISVGVLIALAIGGFIVYRRWKRRRNSEIAGMDQRQNASRDNDSEIEVFTFTPS